MSILDGTGPDDVADVVPLRPELEEDDAAVRTRPRPPFCPHKSTTLDTEARRLYCRSCGREVDPFDFLVKLAHDFERHLEARDAAKRDADRAYRELEEVKRELGNAKARRRRARARTDELAERRTP